MIERNYEELRNFGLDQDKCQTTSKGYNAKGLQDFDYSSNVIDRARKNENTEGNSTLHDAIQLEAAMNKQL